MKSSVYTYIFLLTYSNPLIHSKPFVSEDPCYSDPCRHGGLCSVGDAGFVCSCLDGYEGQMCEIGN